MAGTGVEGPPHRDEALRPDSEEGKSRRRSPTIIGSKYALGDDLGRGSSGRVYKALNTENGDFLAVKEIALMNISETRLASLEMEISMLRRLSHPRVVQYHECITDETKLYIVLEFVENGSLSDILRKFGRLPEQLVIRYIGQVLEALEFVHARAVVHRDIKGANILVTKDGNVKLADFGVARLADDLANKTQSVVGTPYWMAPEIIEMSAFTTASDIWSVGCTVLELLSGAPPHFELTQMSAMYHIVNDAHPPLPHGLSAELTDFLMCCFERDVTKRGRAATLLQHPWLTSTSRSRLALSSDASLDALPDLMTRTVDLETSWLSSETDGPGSPARSVTLAEGELGAEHEPSRSHVRHSLTTRPDARADRQRIVGASDKQRRIAAVAGSAVEQLAEGTPASTSSSPVFSSSPVLSPSVPPSSMLSPSHSSPRSSSEFDSADPPLCGFLWKRGSSPIGKLAYYKRYFYLKDGALCYCSGRTDSTIQQSLEKRIQLTSVSGVDVTSAERFEFHMRCDSRLYQFRSRTVREMHVWVNTLHAVQQRLQQQWLSYALRVSGGVLQAAPAASEREKEAGPWQSHAPASELAFPHLRQQDAGPIGSARIRTQHPVLTR